MLTIKKMILCIAFNLVLTTFSVFAAPRLIVPPEGVAFGEIPAGEAAEKAIELRNVSSSPVLISQVALPKARHPRRNNPLLER